MKKLWMSVAISALLLAACGDDNASKEKDSKEEQGLAVEKNLTSVEITLPAEFFEGQTPEEIKADAEENGIDTVKVNEDGSVYYKMSKAEHKAMLKEMKKGMVQGVDELVNGTDYASIKEISYNKDFTEYDIKVEKASYEDSFDGFAVFSLAFMSSYYNGLAGENLDDLKITFNMIDEATDEVFGTTVYPDDLEDTEADTTEDAE